MDTHKRKEGETKKGILALWRHIKPFRKELAVIGLLGLVSAAANGSVPYVTGRFFDALIALSNGEVASGPWSLPVWGLFLALWAGVQLIANNVDWVSDRKRRYVDDNIHFSIQANGFIHFFRLPLSFYKNTHLNGAVQKIGQLSWRASAIMRTIIQFVPQLLSILIGITLAATINKTLAGILVLGVLLYIFLLTRVLRSAAEMDAKAHRLWNDEYDNAAAAVHQIESVKQSAAERYEERKVRDGLTVRARAAWSILERLWSNVSFYQRTIVFLTQLTIFILSARLVSAGSITVGELVALNGYAMMFFGPFVSLGHSWQVIQNGITTAAQAEDIFGAAEEVYEPENAVAPKTLRGEVVFKNTSFSYDDSKEEKVVLSQVNITVAPGEVVAFVGESGVGKSTAISLISGYYFPTEGEVLIDGVDTRRYNLTALRSHIAVVPQEVALFNDTIGANIKYGKPTATFTDIEHAAEEAHLTEFITALPNGYDTVVGERGIKLSVGQKQRVAIARAILRNPRILILDEPTSALDAKTEKFITKSFERLMKGRTTFIIAHRLSTVRKADKIFVFEKGRIVETGTHEELIAKKRGVYRKLYEYQIGLH